ncbi:glycosyltransferase family 2 protein [Pseudomonas reactans]|uniref:glycosyltransferase family 2 protein n=1 Tax=Pseudomonas reactans TaxID=117680 RepID=UPI0015A3C5CC|nr:glycosyltransferase family 2 protein [Pseudomonas reactans]NWC87999.1 glycosyltransferase family 2 protein [Pseudomonas reactans]NWD31074.1 glycosyltransferase family 2 protein [Pseudomonas reactans]NWF13737.1 glycosyltransferase family 2 protein [Pseudomonas reactans]
MKPLCNPTLSIVIPSYNRADFLDRSLSVHVPMAQRHNIQIFISDNASTDNTQDVIAKWQKQYGLIHSSKNPSTVGPDINFERALKAADTQYVWLLGDTSQIPENGITSILKLAKSPQIYSAIIVNLVDKISLDSKTYDCADLLLTELGGLMSCMSCLIYNKTLIDSADFSRYHDSFFMQTGVILEHAARDNVLIRWEQGVSINSLESPLLQKKGWAFTPKIFEIGVQSWVNFIFSLPPRYSLKSKLSACHSFGKISGAFSIKGMISQRVRGLLTYSVYKQFKHAIRLSIDYPLMVVVIISLTPRPLLKIATDLYLRLKRNRAPEPEH